MKQLKLIIFLGIILSIGFVFAAPPGAVAGQFEIGYQLKFPPQQILKQNQPFTFHVHVFNNTNGYPITTEIKCYFHLYNSSGKHILILEQDTTEDIFDYGFDVDGGNFSKIGMYSYIVQCNNSNNGLHGGFESVPLMVTKNGEELQTPQAMVYIVSILILALVTGLFFCLALTFNHPGVKAFWFAFGFLLIIIIVGINTSFVQNGIGEFDNLVSISNGIYFLTTILAIAGGIALIIWLLIFALTKFNDLRGISIGEGEDDFE